MTLGTEFSDFAVEEITNGEMWTHTVTFTYGPRRSKANAWSAASDGAEIDPQDVKVAAFPVEKAIEEGGRKIAMWEMIVPAASITVRPTEEDTATIDGTRQEIISCVPLGANGTDAAYLVRTMR